MTEQDENRHSPANRNIDTLTATSLFWFRLGGNAKPAAELLTRKIGSILLMFNKLSVLLNDSSSYLKASFGVF